MAKVRIEGLGKRFGETPAVRGVSVEMEDGEFVVLVGPSGSGKSTVLRMIAGLEDPTEGSVRIGERDVTSVPPKDRDIAMVFQDYALYPHMTVFENMAFGLRSRGAPRELVRARVAEASAILGVGELLARYPGQLSGGQRQRVAMGRAIVRDPKVFLFDEPLSNLDAKLRVQMRTEIKRLHQKMGTTVIYVTHDQVEAMTLASRIVILRDGLIEQVGTPEVVYHQPANRFVAGFIGSPSMNFVPCRADAAALRFADGAHLPLPRPEAAGGLAGRDLLFGIRPENLHPSPRGSSGALALSVDVVEPLGSDTLLIGKVAGVEAIARFPQGHGARPGETVAVHPDLARAHLFDAANGARLGTLL